MEQESNLTTFFDSPERHSNEDVLKEILHLKSNALMNQLLEGYPELTIILNEHRQIVAFNSKALAAFKTENYFDIVGKRIGEAINCIHNGVMKGGCGTSQFCRECGAAKAIKATIDGKIKEALECRITTEDNGAEVSFDFLVHTQPLKLEEKIYTLFTVQNISHEKRRDALEKIFFHDVLNTAGAIKGLAEILPEITEEHERTQINMAICTSANQLVNEIVAQRELRGAEDGILEPELVKVTAQEVLENVKNLYINHSLNNENNLLVIAQNEDVVFISDFMLLIRSLGNLVKNALEASKDDQKVILDYGFTEKCISFNVYSEPIIPEHIQNQLFQRSFSTKQMKGRGIGLYSVKLIIEQFLHGKVSFVSNQESKTRFTISLLLHVEE
ncbi:MAG: Signal transduction histidine kinase [Ignavibacteria bacterium]|nr:MAG: Signal transduction histidine kinase [Ignavibacteria bacterium]KAF0157797.1 MAG: Signal transduction histidine kinase [Ignavibacteria bacterium]